jgi:acyl-[acyl-carrier-protein]-phospholipid O-acyltransferase / long-chain-fatty-acid--[acyl-carrier-protein] ligase
MMKDLMTSRRFMPLFFCQFFGALNDNFVRNVLVFLILFSAATTHGPALVSLAGAIFIAPSSSSPRSAARWPTNTTRP